MMNINEMVEMMNEEMMEEILNDDLEFTAFTIAANLNIDVDDVAIFDEDDEDAIDDMIDEILENDMIDIIKAFNDLKCVQEWIETLS